MKNTTGCINELFTYIDSQNWEALSNIFHEDITYERPGYKVFSGKGAVMNFYRKERIVQSGEHRIYKIIAGHNEVVCLGSFTGVSKDNKSLQADFSDYYRMINDGRLFVYRKTFFYTSLI